MDGKRRLFDALKSTAVLLNRVTRARYLTRPCFTAQLGNQFVKLTYSRRTQWMPLRFESARCVDGNASAQCELAAFGSGTTLT